MGQFTSATLPKSGWLSYASMIAAVAYTMPSVHAWSGNTHSVVGAIAMGFLDQNGMRLVQQLIGSNALYDASSWAGYLQSRGKRYNQLHYYTESDITSTDSFYPSNFDVCRYNPERDCLNGKCLAGAVTKHTDAFQCARRQSPQELSDALKFLVHYVADIGQPLLANGRDDGRKDQRVIFEGRSASFLEVWDYYIPNNRINRDFRGNIMGYASYIISQIRGGGFTNIASTWAPQRHLYDKNDWGLSNTAIEWSIDSSRVACTLIWPQFDNMRSSDLGGYYYGASVQVFDMQMAKSGYRLADYINRIAAMTTNGGQCVDFYSSAMSLSAVCWHDFTFIAIVGFLSMI
ncbi:hypothetical protein BASA83_007312 [Batrachochytrium salamandrivorans]|nr:hypothetical protein BASA83_007312 [Batrachochytrium salamandrivorans]